MNLSKITLVKIYFRFPNYSNYHLFVRYWNIYKAFNNIEMNIYLTFLDDDYTLNLF